MCRPTYTKLEFDNFARTRGGGGCLESDCCAKSKMGIRRAESRFGFVVLNLKSRFRRVHPYLGRADFRFQISDFRSLVYLCLGRADFRFQISDFRSLVYLCLGRADFQISDFRFQILDYKPSFRFQISDLLLQAAISIVLTMCPI